MQIGAGTSPMASYVAFTRVKKMEDLLIFRPFDLDLFTQGNLEGPELLLRVLRGEAVDWEAVEQKHMPSHMCLGCNSKNFKCEFSEPQWKRKDGKRMCKTCERELSHDGQKKQCKHCGDWHPEDMFDPAKWRCRDLSELWCVNCKELRKCRGECGLEQPKYKFSDSEWNHAGWASSSRGRCYPCMRQRQDLRLCSGCEQHLPKEMHFSDRMWKKTNKKERKCNACSQAACATEVKTRKCIECTKDLTEACFSGRMWGKTGPADRKCLECCTSPTSPKKRGQWLCNRHDCKQTLPKTLFSMWMDDTKKTQANKSQICNRCFVKARDEEKELNKKTQQQKQLPKTQ